MSDLHILVVDDDRAVLQAITTFLSRRGDHCEIASSGADALLLISAHDFDIMLTDISMGEMDGLELTRRVKNLRPQTVCILMSGMGTLVDLIAAMKIGIFDFLDKPFSDIGVLDMVIERAAASRRLVRERDALFTDLQRQNARLEKSLARLHAAYGQLRQQEETLESDLRQAQRVQRKLLPSGFPRLPGVDLFGYFGPCERLGGDFFGTVPLGDDRLAVYLVDVAGHGVSAAMITIILRELMQPRRSHNTRPDVFAEPGRALAFLNQALVDEAFDPPILVTMVYAMINVPTGRVTLAAAGHPPPIVIDGPNHARLLPVAGPVLGLPDAGEFATTEITLHPGDSLLLYSDGVTEARHSTGNDFTPEQLCGILASQHTRRAAPIAFALEEALQSHLNGHAPADDMTFIVISRSAVQETGPGFSTQSASPLMAGSVRVVLPPRIAHTGESNSGSSIHGGWSAATAVIHLTGLTTWRAAPAMRDILAQADSQATGLVHVEMANCQALDSTMLGLLYQFASKLALHRASERVVAQLREMGIYGYFQFSEAAAPEIDTPITVTLEANQAAYAEMILSAHESLMEVSDENKQRFEGVVASFAAKRSASPNPSETVQGNPS